MEIGFIKEFKVLSELCNYSRAADALFISQSTLFSHIKSLENELGVPLFERDGKKIIVSNFGQIFLTYADRIIDAEDRYRKEIADKEKRSNQIIHIGTQYRITELVKEFSGKYKNYTVYTNDILDYLNDLENGTCELAFVRGFPKQEDKYNAILYIEDRLVVAVYPSHPLAGRSSVSIDELNNESFVMISKPHQKESFGMKLCKEAGFIPKVAITAVNGIEAVRLVAEGAGISIFLKEILASEKIDPIVLINLVPDMLCTIYLCWLKDTELSDGAKAFVEFVKEKSKKILET